MVNEEHKEFVRQMVKKSEEKDPEAKPEYGVLGPKGKEPETQEHKEKVNEKVMKEVEELAKKAKDKAAGISE